MTTPSEGVVNLDDIVPINDFSNETLLALAQRLESSRTFQHLILREVEMDEIFRRVDTVIKDERERGASPEALRALEQLYGLVFRAHDLAADDQPLEAAKLLRSAMTVMRP